MLVLCSHAAELHIMIAWWTDSLDSQPALMLYREVIRDTSLISY